MTLKFDEVFSIMKKSFPQEEMRNYEGQKALLERDDYFIKTYTNEDMLVLDNCMGSGSTGIACINTYRNFIGIELDKQYFDIAKERLTSYKKCND